MDKPFSAWTSLRDSLGSSLSLIKTSMLKEASSDDELIDYLGCVATTLPRDAVEASNLARLLAASGPALAFAGVRTADVASTGGPSSLSTLLCPLFLRVAGLHVPKLGVPGRPAGGIDCLAQVPGYKTWLTEDELQQAMKECGYAHFTAAGRYAPLDARLFRLRQQNGFQEVPTLVAASLLSKKLAVGVSTAGLDVRVAPHGNFGRNFEEAGLNARMYEKAASILGILGRPVLTDGSVPYQAYIGRSEALVAMRAIFDGPADSWLQEHVELCRQLSAAAAPDQGAAIAAATAKKLRQTFVANLVAQGATEAGFLRIADLAADRHDRTIFAENDGAVVVSLEGIRKVLTAAQGAAAVNNDYPDPVGVILRRRPGDTVRRGEVLATVRIEEAAAQTNVLDQLKISIRVRESSEGK